MDKGIENVRRIAERGQDADELRFIALKALEALEAARNINNDILARWEASQRPAPSGGLGMDPKEILAESLL